MTLQETLESEPSTACKDLYTLMSAEPGKVAESSGWTVVRDWALNKFEAGGSFSEYTNEGQPMSLQPAEDWSESLNFKTSDCPVAY